MKVTKNCGRCSKKFTSEGKGCSRVKFCIPCRPLAKKEWQTANYPRQAIERYEREGNPVVEDDKDLHFYGYKEPLTKFKDGFGYVGVVRFNKERDKVQCHFCGRLFKNVGSHAAFVHKIGNVEYKQKVGLLQNTALVGEGTRIKLIEAHKEMPSFSQSGKTKEEIREHMVKMSKKGITKGKGKRNSAWTLERRNQHGNCPEQLVERLKDLEKALGKRPTAKEYQKEYGSFQSIMTVYGTWENALRAAKMTLYTQERAMRSDPKFMLDHLKSFYEKHNRSPRSSDMRRGLLPNYQSYIKIFGTINRARLLANIPLVLMNGRYGKAEEYTPTLEEREKLLKKQFIPTRKWQMNSLK